MLELSQERSLRQEKILTVKTELYGLYEFLGLYGRFCSLDVPLRFTLCDMINFLHFTEKRADLILHLTDSVWGGFGHDWEEDVCLRRAPSIKFSHREGGGGVIVWNFRRELIVLHSVRT